MPGRLHFPGLWLRRVVFGSLVLATTGAGFWLMLRVVGSAGITPLETVILTLFLPTFAWIVLPFWTAVAGFVLGLTRRDPITLRSLDDLSEVDGGTPLGPRTALVMPIYNEDPAAIEARLAAMARGLVEVGHAADFDVHLLSDTQKPEIARVEEAAWARLQGRFPEMAFYYRRRDENSGRKAGNIAEFCHRCGDDYDLMVVLDADSLMAADTLTRMVRVMDANPDVALLQTVPLPIRQTTLLGRCIQFASWMYAPMLATGQSFWHGNEANYWGHNAILRVAAFRDDAQLPTLSGPPPLGGEILSHDFVEAALLRRAGWRVVLDPTLGGSWEELPGNLLDYAKRDRRWAQGSLQHLRLLGMQGLNPLSRLHFLLGAMGFISSLLWLLILLAGTAYVFSPGLRGEAWLPGPGGPPVSMSLLGATAGVLFLPKALGLLLALLRTPGLGGRLALAGSAVLETAFSVLMAPVMMVYHSRFVAEIVLGRSVGWDAQVRDGDTLPWGVALRSSLPALLLGGIWSAATLWVSPLFFLWLSPIFAGLVAAPLLFRWSSNPRLGEGLRRWHCLQTPAEREPFVEIRRMSADLQSLTGVSPLPVETVTGTSGTGDSMYNAERGLFDLRRGRALLVNDSTAAGGPLRTVVASVEGLDESGLRRLEALGAGAPRLVVTRHRASAMGLLGDDADSPDIEGGTSGSVTLCLDLGTPVATVSQLSQGRTGPWAGSAPVACENLRAEDAGLRLAHLGQLLPALVSVPVAEPIPQGLADALVSGEVLQVDVSEVEAFVNTSKTEVVRVSGAPVPLPDAEDSRFVLYREACGLGEHVAVLVGSPEEWPDPLPVRFHSACFTGDLFGSLRCDCGEQLQLSMDYFARQGGGVLLYLAQEGRGIGLSNKFRAYTLQETGLDTIDADGTLGFGADERRYDVAVKILHDLGIQRIELLTNNPEKVGAVEAAGVQVVNRQPLHGQLNRHNLPYVRAKVDRAGHWLHSMLNQGVAGD